MLARTILSAVVAAFFFTFTSAQQTSTGNNCTVFNWDQQPAYFAYSSRTQRVSAAKTCTPFANGNATHFCALSASGDIQAGFYYNISRQLPSLPYVTSNTAEGQGSYVHELVRRQVGTDLGGEPWNASIIGIVDTTQTLTQGTSAFLNFTYLTRCYAGTVSNCTGDIQNGTGIEVCSPVYHTTRTTGAMPILDGRYDQVNISEATISQYPDPFMNQSRGSPNDAERSLGMVFTSSLLLSVLAVSATLIL